MLASYHPFVSVLGPARPAFQIFIVIYSLLGLTPSADPAASRHAPHEIASNRRFNIINLPLRKYVPLIN